MDSNFRLFQIQEQQYMDKLTRHTSYVATDEVTYYGESLLAQLRLAIYNTFSTGERGTGGKRKIVISAEALDLLTEIVKEWGGTGPKLEDTFLKWSIAMSHNLFMNEWVTYVGRLQATCTAIENLLDPPRRLHLAGNCPACGVRMVLVHDMHGELVQQPALRIDGYLGAECRVCGAVWPPSELQQLGEQMGCPPIR